MYLLELRGEPLVALPIGDGWQYDAWARKIAGGDWQGSRAFYQTPLYPYLLAAVYGAVGHSLDAVRAIQAVLGALSCVLLALAGRRFFNDRVGLIAAALLAVYPWAIFADGLIQKSSLDGFLVTALLASLGAFAALPRWRWLIAAGLAAGAFSLNRETGRLLYPIVVAWLLVNFRAGAPLRIRCAWSAAFTGALVAVLLPVAAHNYRTSGEFLLTTSQLGPNFYIGNHAGASGIYEPLTAGGGSAERERDDAARLAEQAAGRTLSPSEISDYWLRQALDYIRRQPGDWLRLTGRKLLLMVNAAEIADTESLDTYAEHSRLLASLSWFNFGIVLPLAVFGIWQSRSAWRRRALLYAILIVLMLSVALFFVLARYRYPAVPVALLFAACGVSALARVREGVRSAAPGLVAAGIAAAVAHLPIASVHRDTTHFNVGLAYLKSERDAEAIPWLQQAVQREPDDAAAFFALGVTFNRAGRHEDAVGALRTAVRLRPDAGEARHALAAAQSNLGSARMSRGDSAEAIAAFRESLALRPDDAAARNNLGLACHAEGLVGEAIRELREAIRVTPDYAEAHANLALMLEATGAIAEARARFEDARRFQPDHPGIRDAFAEFTRRHGGWQ